MRSSPGIFYGDLAAGRYRVTLAKQGFGAKTTMVEIGGEKPVQFRLLADGLMSYVAEVVAERREVGVSRSRRGAVSTLSRWTEERVCGTIAWIDEHGPQANRQILPDEDFTQRGVKWNMDGYPAAQVIVAPERSGLYYLWARTPSGKSFSFRG